MTENVEHYRNQIALARTEIKNLRQQLSALKYEHTKEIKLIKSVLNDLRCGTCSEPASTVASQVDTQPLSSVSDTQPSSSVSDISFRPIGVIETPFQNKRAVPRQSSVLANVQGTIVIDQKVFNNPEHALSGLEEFSHIWVIFKFHATESRTCPAKVSPPRLRGARRGVLATRAPLRPCALGLSLVKIHSIQGNKIHFLGVDMVSGTPVLDIKPYIPQYDSPVSVDTMSGITRPPTEGISDLAEDAATLSVEDDARSLSPRVVHPIRIDTSPLSRSPFEDEASGDHSILLTPVSPSPDSPSSIDLLDGNFRQTRRLETERGAPDGQERFTPPQQSAYLMNMNDGVRVAPWISDPPSQRYEVRFTEESLQRLNDLIGDRAESFKSNIESLLSEDPRSHYVRTRYPDHEYSCVLEDLSISCVFDDNNAVCTIMAVRSAEELQQS
ncbi:tRNA (adenine(37)-N6)-methyltransferase isoform X2 [Plodia interpunctella]|uniref:tRNA (adenine(37)-N6)-methyltransferase isoform X2 n=1 Tax=Plodia interpunctella TaxID=58824 RepID=UPI002368BDCE|nr:tRNA (adenine(37)-N6)-methyltransferase isoform X2 [Plodia interpunctella]